jgi:hypothetical protein
VNQAGRQPDSNCGLDLGLDRVDLVVVFGVGVRAGPGEVAVDVSNWAINRAISSIPDWFACA